MFLQRPGHDPGTGKGLKDVDLLLPKPFLDPPNGWVRG